MLEMKFTNLTPDTAAFLSHMFLTTDKDRKNIMALLDGEVTPAAPQMVDTPAPAPEVPPVAQVQTNGDEELDVDGLPWDARIHSNAAVKKAANGKWKRKRGVAQSLVEQVEAELRGVAVDTQQQGEEDSTPVIAPAPEVPVIAPAPEVPVIGATAAEPATAAEIIDLMQQHIAATGDNASMGQIIADFNIPDSNAIANLNQASLNIMRNQVQAVINGE